MRRLAVTRFCCWPQRPAARAPSSRGLRRGLLGRRAGESLGLCQERGRDRQDSRRDPADPAARQAGLFREFRRARHRNRAFHERGHYFPALFDVEADHERRRHDAGRGWQAAQRSRLEIHSGLRRPEGRGRRQGRERKTGLELEPLHRPITIEDLLRHTSGLTYGFFGYGIVHQLYAEADCSTPISVMPNSSSGSADRRWRSNRLRMDSAIRPTCSAA